MKRKQLNAPTLKPKENSTLSIVDDNYNPEVDVHGLYLTNHGVVPNRSKRSAGTKHSSFPSGFNSSNTFERDWNHKDESYSAYRLIKKNLVDRNNPCNKAISIVPLKQRILPLSAQNLSVLESEPIHDLDRSIIEGQEDIQRINREHREQQGRIAEAKLKKPMIDVPPMPNCFSTALAKTNSLDDDAISKDRALIKSAGLTIKTMKKRLPDMSTVRLTQGDAASIESNFESTASVHGAAGPQKAGALTAKFSVPGATSMAKDQYIKFCSNIVTKQLMKMQRLHQRELQTELEQQIDTDRLRESREAARAERERLLASRSAMVLPGEVSGSTTVPAPVPASVNFLGSFRPLSSSASLISEARSGVLSPPLLAQVSYRGIDPAGSASVNVSIDDIGGASEVNAEELSQFEDSIAGSEAPSHAASGRATSSSNSITGTTTSASASATGIKPPSSLLGSVFINMPRVAVEGSFCGSDALAPFTDTIERCDSLETDKASGEGADVAANAHVPPVSDTVGGASGTASMCSSGGGGPEVAVGEQGFDNSVADSSTPQQSIVFVAGKDGEYVSAVQDKTGVISRSRTSSLQIGVGANASASASAVGTVTAGGSWESSDPSIALQELSLLSPPRVDVADVPLTTADDSRTLIGKYSQVRRKEQGEFTMGEAGLDMQDEEEGGENDILFFDHQSETRSEPRSGCAPKEDGGGHSAIPRDLSESALLLYNCHATRRVQDFMVQRHDIPRPVTSFPLYRYTDTVQDESTIMSDHGDVVVIELLYDIPWKLLDRERRLLGPGVPLNAERDGYLWKHLLMCSLLHTSYDIFKMQVSNALNGLTAAMERPEIDPYPMFRESEHERYRDLDEQLQSVSADKPAAGAKTAAAFRPATASVSTVRPGTGPFVDTYDRTRISGKPKKPKCYSFDTVRPHSTVSPAASTSGSRPGTSSSRINTGITGGFGTDSNPASRPSTSVSHAMFHESRPTTSSNIYRSTKLNSTNMRPKTGMLESVSSNSSSYGGFTNSTKWKSMGEVTNRKFHSGTSREDYQLLHASKRSDSIHSPTRQKNRHIATVGKPVSVSSDTNMKTKTTGKATTTSTSEKFVPEQTHFFTLKFFQTSTQSWKSIRTSTDFDHVKLLAHNLIQNPSSGNCLHQNELLQIIVYAVPEKDESIDELRMIANQATKLPELVIDTGDQYVKQKQSIVTCRRAQSTLNHSPRDANIEIPTGTNVKYPPPVHSSYHYNNRIRPDNAKLLVANRSTTTGDNINSDLLRSDIFENTLSTVSYGHVPTIATQAERRISQGLSNSIVEMESFELNSSTISNY